MKQQEVKLQEFKLLTVEEKQKKLLAIFEFAKDKFDFSESAIDYLSSATLPQESVMEKLSKSFQKFLMPLPTKMFLAFLEMCSIILLKNGL